MDAFPKIVLIVDDDPDITKLMKRQLEGEGYAVMVEHTGVSAIESVKNTRLLAVLLDLGLQDVSGFEVLKAVKKAKPDLPVIMVTGSHLESEGQTALELGAWDYITKPIDFTYLKNILLIQSQQG
jgi:DNA-binding response OmpR family regulator